MSNTAQITLRNGNKVNAVIGSPLYNTYKHTVTNSPMTQQQQTQHNMSNNAQRAEQNYQQWSQPQQQQQSSQPSYTSSQSNQQVTQNYAPSTGIQSITNNSSQNSFNTSSQVTQMLERLRQTEAQLKTMFNSKDYSGQAYNNGMSERNKLSGEILSAITKESGGKISLKELESIYGRKVENQEFDSYRSVFSNNDALQQSQLNNVWEHDFATRNNQNHYGYVQSYMNGDKNAPLAETLKNWIDSQDATARQEFLNSMVSSQQSTQDYFTKRDTGWTPEYVNNTVNPLAWGPVDAGDVINNGGAKLNDAMEYYLKYGLSPYDPRNPVLEQSQSGGMNQYEQMLIQQQQAMEQKIKEMEQENAYKQSQGAGQAPVVTTPQGNLQHVYNPGQTSNGIGYTDSKVVDNQILTQYLDKILKGGF